MQLSNEEVADCVGKLRVFGDVEDVIISKICQKWCYPKCLDINKEVLIRQYHGEDSDTLPGEWCYWPVH